MRRTPRKPELMSPAGGWSQLQAAIEAGADAVYFGLSGFNARAKALAFSHEDLPEVVAKLHERGVQAFVAVNTLVFDNELRTLEQELVGMREAGVDAIIVQDVGVAKLARQLVPDLTLHASTQMTITSAEGARFAQNLGFTRAVLARELSLREITTIAQDTDLELEVFVHGALCVSYSGQCFSSEAWGGRSANRGACAQACRMPYELVVNGQTTTLNAERYLLSPQDLFALEQIPALIKAGVDCLKIEGRYKDADYVAATTRAYRDAIDAAWNGQQPAREIRQEKLLLEGVYSRGLLPAFLSGTNHQTVVQGRAPRHRGVRVGTVTAITRNGVRVALQEEFLPNGLATLKPGDGLVFDAAERRSPQEHEEGGAVFEIFSLRGERLGDSSKQREIELRFGNRALDFSRIAPGDWVWRSSDPAITKHLKPITEAGDPVFKRPVQWQVRGVLGQALQITLTDEANRSVAVQSDEVLQRATRQALDTSTLHQELGKLGDTPFVMDGLEAKLDDGLFLPRSSLGRARREAVQALLVLRRAVKPRLEGTASATHSPTTTHRATHNTTPMQAHISVLVRTPEQLEAAILARPNEIVLDYLELYGLRPSVERVLEAGIAPLVAGPRILKPSEERIVSFLLSLPVAGVLVRSLGLLTSLLETRASLETQAHPTLHGDFSLNAANAVAAQHFLDLGLARLTPSHDLNAQQIQTLAQGVNPNTLEVVLHHHLPVFHTEHCVFCRFLSKGTDHTNCGHPCETERLALRDERGITHAVVADVGCRNTVFEGRAQTGARYLTHWQNAGIAHYRLEFVHETGEELLATTRAYRDVLHHKRDTAWLEHELRTLAPQGTTQGSFVVDHLAMLPML